MGNKWVFNLRRFCADLKSKSQRIADFQIVVGRTGANPVTSYLFALQFFATAVNLPRYKSEVQITISESGIRFISAAKLNNKTTLSKEKTNYFLMRCFSCN